MDCFVAALLAMTGERTTKSCSRRSLGDPPYCVWALPSKTVQCPSSHDNISAAAG
jgi:hypothetical protein